MGGKKNKGIRFDSLNIISVIITRWKFLAGFTLFGVIVSAGVALSIHEKYKSTVVLFPAASVPVSQVLLATNYYSTKGGITSFGEEEEAQQLLQVLNSDKIKDRIIERHHLASHYSIDSTGKYYRTAVRNAFNENIKFRRTEFASIEISVMDRDRNLAAVLANDISDLLDSALNSMRRDRAVKALAIVTKELEVIQEKITEVEDSMNFFRIKGLAGYETQVEVLTDRYGYAVANGNMTAARTIEERLKFLGAYGTKYVEMRSLLDLYFEQRTDTKLKEAQARVDAEQELPNTFIVDKAVPADKKSYPVRWLIVMVSTIATFFFALLAILIFDNLETLRG